MLKKDNRLKVRARLEKSQTVLNPLFTLKYGKNEKGVNRFAVIVSKKVDIRAVARNRTRRQIMSCIEKIIDKTVLGFDFLFIVKKEAVGKKTIVICKAIESIIKKENLIK